MCAILWNGTFNVCIYRLSVVECLESRCLFSSLTAVSLLVNSLWADLFYAKIEKYGIRSMC
jgi:hypothetical protein